MNTKENKLQVTAGLQVVVLPHAAHEFLMTTKEVAHGYGVSADTVRSHKGLHREELIAGKHFVLGVDIFNAGCKSMSYNFPQDNVTYWTKRGIVRLVFFIKSKRARLFRDWAEDLILKIDQQHDLFGEVSEYKPLPGKRKHNRLTQERMVAILADVCRIENSELRNSIVNKLIR